MIEKPRSKGSGTRLSIKEITTRFIAAHGEDYERKITPHWIGQVIRTKLGLRTERRRDGYILPHAETQKLEGLNDRFSVIALHTGPRID